MTKFNELSTEEVLNQVDNNDSIIVDARPVDAYNGWKIKNESRGGHIKGAKSLPVKWTNYMDWIEIVRSKFILPDHKIIIYGYTREESNKLASMFSKTGYQNISLYNLFVEEWSGNKDLPMEKLDRYHQLVYPNWVKTIVDGDTPPDHYGKNTVICHAHYRNREAYLSGHIPGAIDIDTLALEAPETWNRRSPEELKKALEEHGITADTTVVIYGKFMSPDNEDDFPGSAAGHIGAIRNAFIMMYAGVKDVKVLNGGFQSWKDAGYEIETIDEPKNPVKDFGAIIPAKPELAVDVPEAKEMIASKVADIVCVRSWPEYIGEVSGYNYIKKKGRIPGTIFGNCGSDAYHMENYRNVDHTIREAQEVVEIWKEAGITPDKHLAFYCGTGWRGSEAFYNAWLMGWPKVSVFDGGWFEWSNDLENPYETGEPNSIDNHLPKLGIENVKDEIIRSLKSTPKQISSKFFYDKVGSKLFEEITQLEEYYPTRTETKIISSIGQELDIDFTNLNIIELGSGDPTKISLLLRQTPDNKLNTITYHPVDISKSAIRESAQKLAIEFPMIKINGVVADFIHQLDLVPFSGKKLFCFFGSTLGNFEIEEVENFLIEVGSVMEKGDSFLLGLDMVKDVAVLEKAYNDDKNTTAEFNRNILNVVNKLAGLNFNPDDFEHYAFYNKDKNRIEMHLKAIKDINVSINGNGEIIKILKKELIHTENSHKFSKEIINTMASWANLEIKAIHTDKKEWFSLVHYVKK